MGHAVGRDVSLAREEVQQGVSGRLRAVLFQIDQTIMVTHPNRNKKSARGMNRIQETTW
jgi:hypothetical protein